MALYREHIGVALPLDGAVWKSVRAERRHDGTGTDRLVESFLSRQRSVEVGRTLGTSLLIATIATSAPLTPQWCNLTAAFGSRFSLIFERDDC